jgi:hypothetical protein
MHPSLAIPRAIKLISQGGTHRRLPDRLGKVGDVAWQHARPAPALRSVPFNQVGLLPGEGSDPVAPKDRAAEALYLFAPGNGIVWLSSLAAYSPESPLKRFGD